MSHSFDNADRRTHAKVIFAAVLCSAVALFCLAFGLRSNASTTQVVKAKAAIDVSHRSSNAVR
jgi:hypothetical protein